MPILEAQIETERASRYLVQFCKHAAAMGGGHTQRTHLHSMMSRRQVQVTAEWSDTTGAVTFTPWGRCTLTADTGTLTLRIDAADEDGLTQIRDVITRDLARFSQRDPLTVTWQPSDNPGPAAAAPGRPHRSRRSHLQTILLTLGVTLVIGLHLGLAGGAIAGSPWTGMATNLIVALILLKITLVVLARRGIRRRRAAKTIAP